MRFGAPSGLLYSTAYGVKAFNQRLAWCGELHGYDLLISEIYIDLIPP